MYLAGPGVCLEGDGDGLWLALLQVVQHEGLRLGLRLDCGKDLKIKKMGIWFIFDFWELTEQL